MPMRPTAVLLSLVTACSPAYWPEPRPARSECSSSTVYTGGMGRSVYANGAGECVEYPADECYGNDSDWCRQRAEERAAHNAGEDRRQRVVIAVGLVLLGAAAVCAGIVAAYN